MARPQLLQVVQKLPVSAPDDGTIGCVTLTTSLPRPEIRITKNSDKSRSRSGLMETAVYFKQRADKTSLRYERLISFQLVEWVWSHYPNS